MFNIRLYKRMFSLINCCFIFTIVLLTKSIRTRNLIRHGDELGGLSSSLMIDYNIYYIEKGRSYIDM